MRCPKCKEQDTRVADSRVVENGKAIRRRRHCDGCGLRFTTFERAEFASFIVVKKDGTREPYNRLKLEEGIWRACSKRPVTQKQVDALISELEEHWSSNKKEITTTRIGNEVMVALRKLDEIAYIRFASVYRSFKDVAEFKEELNQFLGQVGVPRAHE
jgi:transcriptional repressor NrdR